jgi:hypothetical protein
MWPGPVMRRAARSAGLALAALLLFLGCGQAPIESGQAPASTRSPATSTSPSSASISPGQADPTPFAVGSRPEPSAAAAAVLDAASDSARRDAILAIFAAVGIGVYAPDGTAIVVGAERSPDDFFAYDFEVDALAVAVRDGDASSVADLAEDLAASGFIDGDRAFTADEIASAIQRGASNALADPGEPTGYAIQVVRALELYGPTAIDIAAPTAGDPLRLDALSAFLVAADITLPSLDAGPPPTASIRGQLASADRSAPLVLVASAACDNIGRLATTANRSVGQVARELLRGGVGPSTVVDPYLQSVLMHSAVDATLQSPTSWHYFHKDTGNTGIAAFQLSLTLRVRPSQQAIDCGLLAGVTMPPEGPIQAAPVMWDDSRLKRHGTDVCPQYGCQETGNDGLAILEHTQKTEPGPGGVGPEMHELVTVKVKADILRALGPGLAAILQAPLVVRAERQVDIKWHRSYQVKLELESILVVSKANFYIGKVATARASGTFDVSDARSPDGFSTADAVTGFLTVSTTPGPDAGKCNTVTASGRGKIDWQIREAIIWPPEEIAAFMDTGRETNNRDPDKYWFHACVNGKTVINDKNDRGSVWESNFSLGHPYGKLGFAFEGLAANNGWSVLATEDTWQRGGLVAIWEGDERCGGYCSSGHIELKLSVTPLPGT